MKLVKHLVILLILLSTELAWSQKYDVQTILTEYEELLLNVGASVNDIPFSARRIALFDVTSKSDKPIIITQKLLRLQLEDVLKKKAFSVISVPEFEKKMILKIEFKISNSNSEFESPVARGLECSSQVVAIGGTCTRVAPSALWHEDAACLAVV